MSDHTQLPLEGFGQAENRPTDQSLRASLYREMRYLLTISSGASRVGHLSSAGVAHSLGVCLIEDWNMARGKSKGAGNGTGGTLPKFVDVRLSSEQREEFADHILSSAECAAALQHFADDGYRVGVSWSGEHQSYTVSVTCRQEGSDNEGLCMTSFAGDLVKAVSLAVYKHVVVTGGVWQNLDTQTMGDFC